MSTTITKQARLACVDIKTNKQKLYWMDLYSDGRVRIRYGRVNDVGGVLSFQHDDYVSGGEALFNKKYREKTRVGRGTGTYIDQPLVAEVESNKLPTGASSNNTNLEQIALAQIETNSDVVRDLIKYLSQSNIHNITSNTDIKYNDVTGLFTTAFGLVTNQGISEARDCLAIIKKAFDLNTFDKVFEGAIDKYLSIIPKNIARRNVSYTTIFNSVDEVLKQNDILDALESSLVDFNTRPADDNAPKSVEKLFDVRIDLVDDITPVASYYKQTAKGMHAAASGFEVKKVYSLDLRKMSIAFKKEGEPLGDVRQLWHGTSASNILSILRSGFQIAPPSTAYIAGKNFANGIYTAPCSTKSMGYATNFWGGSGGGNNKAFMFLNDVALGKFYVPRSTTSSPPPQGYHTYWAKVGETEYIQNDEIVVFSSSQMNPVYLVQLEK